MPRLNVLFLIPQMGIGGSERLVLKLAERLDRSRFQPSVAWLTGEPAVEEFRALGVPLHSLPKTRRLDLGLMRRIADLMREQRIDVVNAQHFMPAVYGYPGCRIAGRRALVYTAHSRWEVEEITGKWRVIGGSLLRRIDACVGVTPDVAEAVRTVFRTTPSKTLSIENGVDTEAFRPSPARQAMRLALRLDESDVVFGIVANLKQVKNHLFLLEAFTRLAKREPRARLLVVGQGFAGEADNTEPHVRAFVRDNGLDGRVSLLGYRTDIAGLLQAMDVFCLVSRQEGLPIGLIEAMSTGLPVIGTDVAGIAGVIDAGVDGRLVTLDDVPALDHALTSLADDPALRERLGRAGRQKAIARYSLQRCVEDYERLFAEVSGR